MTFTRTLGICCLAIVIGGCNPILSRVPLDNQVRDDRLIGEWSGNAFLWEGIGESNRMKVRLVGGTRYSATIVPEDPDDIAGIAQYEVIPSKIGNQRYLSIRQVFPRSFLREYARSNNIDYNEARAYFNRGDPRMNGYYLAFYDVDEELNLRATVVHEEFDGETLMKLTLGSGLMKGELIEAKHFSRKIGDEPTEAIRLSDSPHAVAIFMHMLGEALDGSSQHDDEPKWEQGRWSSDFGALVLDMKKKS